MVISSGAILATESRIGCATAAVTRPAPVRNAASAAIDGAPAFPYEPPITNTWPNLPLLLSAGRGVSVIFFDAPAQVRFKPDWIASSGDPIGATTMGL